MMYRLNVQHPPQSQPQQQQQQAQTHPRPHSSQQLSPANSQHLIIQQAGGQHLLSGDSGGGGGGSGGGNGGGIGGNNGLNANGDDLKILTAIKSEPMHDMVLPTVSAGPPGISVVSIGGGTVGVAGNGSVVLSASGALNNSSTSSASASTSANSTNGHLVFVPTKRVRLDG